MSPILLSLPYPISANRYWLSFVLPRSRHVMTAPTKEALAYKKTVATRALLAGIVKPITGRVKVEYWLYPHLPIDAARREKKLGAHWDNGVQCLDLDNPCKVLMDSLKGVVIEDDKWVWSLHGYRMKPDGIARLDVRISEWEDKTRRSNG